MGFCWTENAWKKSTLWKLNVLFNYYDEFPGFNGIDVLINELCPVGRTIVTGLHLHLADTRGRASPNPQPQGSLETIGQCAATTYPYIQWPGPPTLHLKLKYKIIGTIIECLPSKNLTVAHSSYIVDISSNMHVHFFWLI